MKIDQEATDKIAELEVKQIVNYLHVSDEPIDKMCSRCYKNLKGIDCWFIDNKYVCVECSGYNQIKGYCKDCELNQICCKDNGCGYCSEFEPKEGLVEDTQEATQIYRRRMV